MKRLSLLFVLFVSLAAAGSAQVTKASIDAGLKRFPGISRSDMETLLAAKRMISVPLPTWLPAGFALERIKSRLGRAVTPGEHEFVIIYSKKLPNAKVQRFSIEAGLEGIGDLPYDRTKQITSPVGKIDMMYEPPDPDGGGKLKNYSMTEWFKVGRTDFHFDGMYNYQDDKDPHHVMISQADTEKILRSITRL